jgi:hypothetical protein
MPDKSISVEATASFNATKKLWSLTFKDISGEEIDTATTKVLKDIGEASLGTTIYGTHTPESLQVVSGKYHDLLRTLGNSMKDRKSGTDLHQLVVINR